MSYLETLWRDHASQSNPARRYASQREFEADWVYALRRRYGISQEALAVLADVSVTTVQNWENPVCRKNIAPHNQTRLQTVERDLWIKSHVTLLEPCPAPVRAIHDLMAASRDESAQALADYLITTLDARNPDRARLLHWAALAHSIADPRSRKAREYSAAAVDALGDSDAALSAAIENEILGYQMEDLVAAPGGDGRTDAGYRLMRACERLFERDRQPAYRWNALEVACRAPLPETELYRLVGKLIDVLGEEYVRRRIQTEAIFERARDVFAVPGTVN